MRELNIKTSRRDEMIDITRQIAALLPELGIVDGSVHIFSPHTTAAVTINEACDPDVARDMLYYLDKLVRHDDPNYRHAEGNSAAHIKTSLMGAGVLASVADGKLQLGTWQGVFFCEFDGPRNRTVWLRAVSG